MMKSMKSNLSQALKKATIGYDFDGVADHMELESNCVIITGRPKEDEDILREKVGKRPIYFYADKAYEHDEKTDLKVAKFKEDTIRKLGLSTYYEDTPEIISYLKKHSDAEIIEVPLKGDFEYQEGVLNIIWLSDCGIGFPIAQKLVDEGNNLIIGYVQDLENPEEPEVKRRRLSLYDGLLHKRDIEKVFKRMETLENKEKWIVFCDFNSLAPYAERALAMGFTQGFFPTQEDLELEKNRDKAKEIVKQYYKDLSVAEVHEFKSAQDGIDFLTETDGIWVLKGNSDDAKTLVPRQDDPEIAKLDLLDALDSHGKNYESEGFILEEKIIGGLELTPQMVWLDGEVVFTDIDIENKNIAAGNVSVQTGAMQTLVIKSKQKDKINQIAFPDWIHKQAKKHKGLFVADAGIIVKDDKYYFTEFCFQRFGFDSVFCELDMAGSATDFFTKLFNGRNPLAKDFGVATRGMNMHKDDKERRVLEGVSMTADDPEHTWIYECTGESGNIVSTGVGWDLVVFTASGESIEKCVEMSYKTANSFAFEDLYLRPDFDFLSSAYPTSIPNRFNGLNHKLFGATDMEDFDKYQAREKIDSISKRLDDALKNDEQE